MSKYKISKNKTTAKSLYKMTYDPLIFFATLQIFCSVSMAVIWRHFWSALNGKTDISVVLYFTFFFSSRSCGFFWLLKTYVCLLVIDDMFQEVS